MKFASLATLVILALSSPATAIPPDRVIRMEAGSDRFEKGYRGDWVATSLQADLVEAQAFDTAEVHLTAKKAGTCLVLLHNPILRQVAIWRVEVDVHPPSADPAPVQKACACDPGLRPLACRLVSVACIDSLRSYLGSAGLSTDELRLTYTVQGLQIMAKALEERIAAAGFTGIELGFVGTNVRLKGIVTDRQAWSRLVLLVYEGFLGRLILEDELVIADASDGGPRP